MNEKQRLLPRCEGSLVDGLFRLEQFLGEGEDGAVFRTDFSRRRAIIKLIPAGPSEGSAQLDQWTASAKLNHPHLVRILASGRSTVKNTPVIYIVTEFADETMADVLHERQLSPTEARDVLVTALETLAYLHGQGLAHGRVKASNFLAVGDKLKLSSDSVMAGDPSPDVKMLGALFEQVLAHPLPQPFLDITTHAADPNPETRWTIAEIATRLDGRMPVRSSASKPALWIYILPALAIVVIAAVFLISKNTRQATSDSAAIVTQAPVTQPPAPVVQPPQPAASEPAPAPKRLTRAERRAAAKAAKAAAKSAAAAKSTPAPSPAPSVTPAAPAPVTPSSNGILDQPMPDVPAQASHTIHGKVVIPVRVTVDASGKVTDAKLDPRAGSHYFAGLALKAARQWKFAPTLAPETWVLKFEFTRDNTKVSPSRAAR